MKSAIVSWCIGLVLIMGPLAHAFENLDFESAMPVITGDPDFDIFQLTADVLPYWSPLGTAFGPTVFTDVYFNGGHLGLDPPIFNVFDDSAVGGFSPDPIEGDYSLQIYTLGDAPELYQTGLVPSFSKSIRFTGDIIDVSANFGLTEAGSFDLYLGGTKLSLQELGPNGNYKEYGANIPSSLANTVSELRFTMGSLLDVRIDDIRFSPLAVPEPSTFLLCSCGAAAVVGRRRRNKAK